MNPHRIAVAAMLLVVSFAASALAPPALAGRRGPQQFGEVKPDKALVYFIRTSRMVGGGRTQYLYADDSFLGVIRSGSYGFAYVDPGTHLMWTNWTHVTHEIEFAAGETYYLDVWQTIGIVDAERGKALIEEVEDFVTPTESDRETAAGQIAHRYQRAQRKESEKDKAEVAAVLPSAAPPEKVDGMVKVPANTPVTLELLENVCSSLTETGETVWFRVADDVTVDGHVCLRKSTLVKGTVRESEPARGGGKEGILDILVPAVPAEDGSVLPTIGQIASSGEERGDASFGAGYAFGVFGALAVKGRQAYHLAGQTFTVHVRQETLVHPGAAPAAAASGAADGAVAGVPGAGTEVAQAEPGAAGTEATPGGAPVLKALAPEPIRFRPKKGKVTDTVEIDLETEPHPRDIVVYEVGTWNIPEPVRATVISRHGKVWRCDFAGWDLARYMREGKGDSVIPVKMRGTFEDGKPFLAEARLTLSVDRE
jgi:hypothetical protein